MNYNIAIPTLGRYTIITTNTLKVLEDNNIPNELINIFVVEDEYELYKNVIGDKYKLIIGVRGIVQQRKFIENYYPKGHNILYLDDDIKEIDLQFSKINNLDEFIKFAFQDCIDNKSFIWSVYPVYNPFFRKSREYKTDCLNMMIGPFYGIINRPNDPELTIKYSMEGNKEDIERSILYFKKDGKTIRYNQIGFKTKYYGSVGGLGTLKDRLPTIISNAKLLEEHYPKYGKIKIRKNGIYEFILKKIKAFEIDNEVIVGNPIDSNICEKLLSMLNSIKFSTIRGKSNRHNFPIHKAAIFGLTCRRFTNKIGLSSFSLKYKEIYEELKNVAKQINPDFVFDCIHINQNLVCPKHLDGRNVGKSMLVSIGDYNGCNLVVNNVEYNTKYRPIYFNGALLEHYNTDNLEGNKYSIVYYKSHWVENKE